MIIPFSTLKLRLSIKSQPKKKKEKDNQEDEEHGEKYYPPHDSEIKEGEIQINESKALEWMDSKIKVKEYNISIEGQPKMAKIGDYWSEQHTTKIINLLKEYPYVFTRDYKYLKGLVKEIGYMKINLIPKAKPIKKRPYKLAHKYKHIVKTKFDNMLTVGIIYPVDQ